MNADGDIYMDQPNGPRRVSAEDRARLDGYLRGRAEETERRWLDAIAREMDADARSLLTEDGLERLEAVEAEYARRALFGADPS